MGWASRGAAPLAACFRPCNRLSRKSFGPPIWAVRRRLQEERRFPAIRFLQCNFDRHAAGTFQHMKEAWEWPTTGTTHETNVRDGRGTTVIRTASTAGTAIKAAPTT